MLSLLNNKLISGIKFIFGISKRKNSFYNPKCVDLYNNYSPFQTI